MSLFNKTSNLFINGNSVKYAYFNGNILWSGYIYYRWQITQTKTMPPGANAVQAAEFVFQIDGVDQSMSGVVVTNPNGSNPVGEEPSKLVDGNLNTKGLDLNFVANGNLTNFIFQFPTARYFNGYRWATANDAEDRDPKDWTIAGSNDGVNWVTLHTVTDFTSTSDRNTYQTPQIYNEIEDNTPLTPISEGLVLSLDAATYIGSGNWLDTSGNNNDGTLVQTPTYSSNEGGYFDLDGGVIIVGQGEVDSFSISDDNTLDTMSEISIEMWINIDSIDGTSGSPNMLFSKRGTNTNGYVGFFTNSQFLFRVGTGSPNQVSWSTTPSTSVWQQIVVTVGSNGSKIYQNGVEVVSSAYVGNFNNINTTANLVIGDINPNNSGIRGFNGKISIFNIYDTILSSTDVTNNFEAIKDRYGL